MLNKTIVIVEKEQDFIFGVFCNNPNLNIDSGTVKNNKLPDDVDVEQAKIGTVVECESCGSYHRKSFTGDCRNDNERFVDCT